MARGIINVEVVLQYQLRRSRNFALLLLLLLYEVRLLQRYLAFLGELDGMLC